jgi:hypothetical protein
MGIEKSTNRGLGKSSSTYSTISSNLSIGKGAVSLKSHVLCIEMHSIEWISGLTGPLCALAHFCTVRTMLDLMTLCHQRLPLSTLILIFLIKNLSIYPSLSYCSYCIFRWNLDYCRVSSSSYYVLIYVSLLYCP